MGGSIFVCLEKMVLEECVTWASNIKNSSCLLTVRTQAVSSSSAVVERKYGFPASLSSPEYRTVDLN